jgi:hypothetical protein
MNKAWWGLCLPIASTCEFSPPTSNYVLTFQNSHGRWLFYAHTHGDEPGFSPNFHGPTTLHLVTACRIPRLQLHPLWAFHRELRGQTLLLDKARESGPLLCYQRYYDIPHTGLTFDCLSPSYGRLMTTLCRVEVAVWKRQKT